MEDKIKILFFNADASGVNYYRTNTPAIQLQRDHSDKFYVDITNELDFNDPKTIDYLKSFHIIHYHRQIVDGADNMLRLKNELSNAGVIMVMDIDDYWYLDKTHPYYASALKDKMHENIIDNLKIADYITTTTEVFKKEIMKITKKDNVSVFANSVDPSWMKQFEDNRKPDSDGLVRISYAGGSSHGNDIEQLRGLVNRLQTDPQTKNKFKIILAGWDTEGFNTETKFNEELKNELDKRGLLNRKTLKEINKADGDIYKVPSISNDLKERFKDNMFTTTKRPINSDESVYLKYEKILTDNYRIIDDEDYMKHLRKYERSDYPNEKTYGRRWTKKANVYAKVLDETDIFIAPLGDNKFNSMKSNLKQVECWTRKIPVVCTDIVTYNVDGVDGRNCFLIPPSKNADKKWFKAIKKLILDENLRKEIGQNLYDDFKEKYHLGHVTNKRANFYENVTKKELLEIA